MDDKLKVTRRIYIDRTSQRVALCMFTIVVILALYAVAQRLG
jgi:hypothetical protein